MNGNDFSIALILTIFSLDMHSFSITLNSHASGSGSDSSWNLEPLPSSYGSTWFRFRGHVSQVYLTKVPQVLTRRRGLLREIPI